MKSFRVHGPSGSESQRPETPDAVSVAVSTRFLLGTSRLPGRGRGRHGAALLAAGLVSLLAIAAVVPALLPPTNARSAQASNPDVSEMANGDLYNQPSPSPAMSDEGSPVQTPTAVPSGAAATPTTQPYDPNGPPPAPFIGKRWDGFAITVSKEASANPDGDAWGDRTFIEINAPVGATCSVQLRFPSGVVLDLGTHEIKTADTPRYRIWWVVPNTAGRGGGAGKTVWGLGAKQGRGGGGYLSFAIAGGAHRPEQWSIGLYDDGFSALAGSRSNLRVTTTRL